MGGAICGLGIDLHVLSCFGVVSGLAKLFIYCTEFACVFFGILNENILQPLEEAGCSSEQSVQVGFGSFSVFTAFYLGQKNESQRTHFGSRKHKLAQ